MDEVSCGRARCLTGDPCMADIVFAAGRGLKSASCFKKLLVISDMLNAQIVGTRAAVDLGWIPSTREVGLCGIRIAPAVYVAFGVSGANFHTMGMLNAGFIIAVNTDKNAAIFRLADYCVCERAEVVLEGMSKELAGICPDSTVKVQSFLLECLVRYPGWHNKSCQ